MVPASATARIIPKGVAEAARHFVEGSTEQALTALQAAGAADGESVPLKFMTALVAWRLGDVALALTMSRACFEREPENGTIAEAVASLYAQAGELRESLFYGKLAIALAPDATMSAWFPVDFPMFDKAFLSIQDKPLLSQARLLLGRGDWQAALEKARQHVAVAPHDEDGRHFYAEQLLRAGFPAAAVETLALFIDGKIAAPEIASTIARALAAVGEGGKARHWHDQACAMATDDAAIAAARIADAQALGDDGEGQKRWAAEWLARFTTPGKAQRLRPAGERLTVGYLVSHTPRKDAPAVATVASAHSRSSTTVIGYGRGAQSWDENTFFGSAFDKWRDITGFDAATLAKALAVDGVDVVVDAAGIAAPTNIRALARVNSAIRVAWLGAVEGFQGAIYDATLGLAPTGIERWRSPHGSYPLLRDWTREVAHVPDARCRFGSAASLADIDARTVALWSAALTAAPEAVLLLRAEDMAHPANVNRLIERVGRELAARIDIVDAAVAEDFYRQVDIILAPAVAPSPRLVAEAVACEVPVLALDNGSRWCIDGDALRALGLGEFVFKDVSAFAAAAANLARGRQARDAARTKAAAVATMGERVAVEIAQAIEQGAKAMLSKAAA